jgi:3-dehydroquinate dehydratase/shikimate dehydrogenase
MAILCVPLTGRTADEMLAAMRALPPFVQAVEARMDYMAGDVSRLVAELEALCRGKDRALIVTVRPKREGGLWDGPEPQRLDLLRRACALGAEYIDVELDSVAALGETCANTRRIVSHHNFQQTPADLEALHREAAAAGADVVKITVTARDITDTLPVFALLKRHAARIPTIALSMGEEGLPTRVLASKFGGFLTYASLEAGKGSAPGQVPWRDMEQMYRFHRIGPTTPVYGVVANPVAHSMSPAIQNAAFAELGMDAVYLPFKVAEPKAFLDGYQPLDLRGLSVTIPHKEAMLALMDETDELSQRVGAVNTVDIRGGRRYGSNTDVAAALAALTGAAERAGLLPLTRRTVLMVGAGGAGRALAYGLAGQAGRLFIANRTASRAERLAADVGADTCGLDEIGTLRPDVLINTTSVGMYPNVDDTPAPVGALRKGMVVFDAVYNPIETRLLREAREAGCVTASGFDWFVSQAAAQFEIWTGRPAPRDIMADVVRRRLSRA